MIVMAGPVANLKSVSLSTDDVRWEIVTHQSTVICICDET